MKQHYLLSNWAAPFVAAMTLAASLLPLDLTAAETMPQRAAVYVESHLLANGYSLDEESTDGKGHKSRAYYSADKKTFVMIVGHPDGGITLQQVHLDLPATEEFANSFNNNPKWPDSIVALPVQGFLAFVLPLKATDDPDADEMGTQIGAFLSMLDH